MSGFAASVVQHQDEEIQEHLALKISKACVEELHRTGGTETPLLERTHKVSHILSLRAKQ